MERCSQKSKKLCGHQKPEEARADSYTGTSTSNLDVRSDTDFCSVLQNCYRMKICCSESAGLQRVATAGAGKEQANGEHQSEEAQEEDTPSLCGLSQNRVWLLNFITWCHMLNASERHWGSVRLC